MIELLAIAVGGAAGAVGRFLLTNLVTDLMGGDFPWGILLVNVVGSFLIGVVFVLLVEKALMSEIMRNATMVGLLGAFTTFSTFSLQAVGLLASGRALAAGGYILSSVFVCIGATALGMWLAR